MRGKEFQQCPCTRRTAMKVGAGVVGCLASGATLTGCAEATLDQPFTIVLADYPELAEVGGVAEIPSSVSDFDFPIFVYRGADDDYTAYSSECTHFGCEVEFRSVEEGYECPCHGSMFDVEGRVLNGPAKQDLVHFDVQWDDETLTMSP